MDVWLEDGFANWDGTYTGGGRRRKGKKGGGLVEEIMGSVVGMLSLRYSWAPNRDATQEMNIWAWKEASAGALLKWFCNFLFVTLVLSVDWVSWKRSSLINLVFPAPRSGTATQSVLNKFCLVIEWQIEWMNEWMNCNQSKKEHILVISNWNPNIYSNGNRIMNSLVARYHWSSYMMFQ